MTEECLNTKHMLLKTVYAHYLENVIAFIYSTNMYFSVGHLKYTRQAIKLRAGIPLPLVSTVKQKF